MSGPGDAPLWSGRFAKPPAAEAEALTKSLAFDVRLAAQDVEATIAQVQGLEDAGLVTPDEATAIEKALREVGAEIASGTFAFSRADEDVHSAIERSVIERLGDVGAKLHAGRSRNDLVVTDVRLWLLSARWGIDEGIERLVRALVGHARSHTATVMPGTTHGRLAQPVTLGHHVLAHAWALLRDLERLDEWAFRTSVSPLGAGALATSTLPLDPRATAARLGFDRAFANSIDAVSDRDFAQEFLSVSAILGSHLSRLAADLARWSDESLAWASLDDSYSTGSSMMPQKRNPDVAELARAKAGRLLGHLVTVTSVLNGLPLGYHRDLQEDKEPLFDAVETLESTLAALAGCVETTTFDAAAMRRATEIGDLYATDLAEALVKGGVPFRAAHHRVGELLKRLDAEGRTLGDLSSDEWAAAGLREGAALLNADHAVRARSVAGGPSAQSVTTQATAIEAMLVARRRR